MSLEELHSRASAKFNLHDAEYLLFEKIDMISEEWDNYTCEDLYYRSDYLKIIENSPSLQIRPFYMLVVSNGHINGAHYFQLKTFKLAESMMNNDEVRESFVKKQLSKIVQFSTLVNGNLLLTGKYGYYESRKKEIDIAYLESVNTIVCDKVAELTGNKPKGFLMKDYYNVDVAHSNYKGAFTPCVLHPNMIMEIDQGWKDFEDYVSALNTKYRTRLKRAKKKLEGINSNELDVDDMIQYQNRMNELYQNIALNAEFNLFILPEDYFIQLKVAFGDNLIVKGYFKEDRLIGFYTCLSNNGHLDAHFLGYDLSENTEHQLYLNMLYNMIELGIEKRCKKIFMSRTAIEIKNSVGAVPHDMMCFFRYNHAVINRLVKPLFEYYKPESDYILRSPFKNIQSIPPKKEVEEKESCALHKIVCRK